MFGSYDIEGVDPTKKMSIVMTKSASSFEIALLSMSIGENAATINSEYVIMDPQEDMISMNPHDFKSWKVTL